MFVHVFLGWINVVSIFCLYLELKLTQSTERGLRSSGGKHRTTTEQREASLTETEVQPVNNSNTTPSMEETINLMNNRLKQRRRELGLPEAVKVGIHVRIHNIRLNISRRQALTVRLHGREGHLSCPCVCRTCPISR